MYEYFFPTETFWSCEEGFTYGNDSSPNTIIDQNNGRISHESLRSRHPEPG